MQIRLGAVYIDAVVDDNATTRPVLINRIPENAEVDVPTTSAIDLQVTDHDADGLADITEVYVTSIPAAGGAATEVLALDRPAGFHADYLASSTFLARLSPGAANNDEHVIHLVRSFAWTSSEIVQVRVVARSADVAPGGEVQFIYSFTVEDVVRPFLLAAETRSNRRVRVTFSEPILRDGSAESGDALAVREITGGVSFLDSPARLTCPGGNFVAADVGRFVQTSGCDDVRGDDVFRILAVDSATTVRVAAPTGAPYLPFAAAVQGPTARAAVTPIAIYAAVLQNNRGLMPDTAVGEITIGQHVAAGTPDGFDAEWFWDDNGADSFLRARQTDTALGRLRRAGRTPRFPRDNAFASYDAAALAAAAATNPNGITLAFGTTPVPGIVVSVNAVSVARFLTLGTSPVIANEDTPARTPVPILARAVTAADVPTAQDATAMVDIDLHDDLTPNAVYIAESWVVEDLSENVVRTPGDNPANTRTLLVFFSTDLAAVEGRRFDVYRDLLTQYDRATDLQHHALRFAAVLQEPLRLALQLIDRFQQLWDPQLSPVPDTLLEHLGNPFRFAYDLSESFKRRLIEALTLLYRRAGTEAGIEATLDFFFGDLLAAGQNFDVRPLSAVDAWELDVDELDTEAILGIDTLLQLYSFEVASPIVLTAAQRQQLTDIVDIIRPAHTHLVRIVEP